METFKGQMGKPITDINLINYITEGASKATANSKLIQLNVGDDVVIDFSSNIKGMEVNFYLVVPNIFSIVRMSDTVEDLNSDNTIIQEDGKSYEIETVYPEELLKYISKLYVYSALTDYDFFNKIESSLRAANNNVSKINNIIGDKVIKVKGIAMYKTSSVGKLDSWLDNFYNRTFSSYPKDEKLFNSININNINLPTDEAVKELVGKVT